VSAEETPARHAGFDAGFDAGVDKKPGAGRGWWWVASLIAACTVVVGCEAGYTDDEAPQVDLDVTTQAIIYGEDDRIEVFEHPDAKLRAIAQSAFVALIPRSHFARTTSGDFAIFTRPLKDAFEVCEDARFASQPTAADCSGVLIDDDLVLTAGHCFSTDEACERFAFMFDYYFRAPGKLEPMGWGDVYGCRRVVHRQVTIDATAPRIDFAVVQLDRTPVGRSPVPLRTTALSDGESLSTLGCVSGLPAKVDSGAHVLSARASTSDFFLLDSDTFQGSSGSGVFDLDAKLVGVLVRGGEDYVQSTEPDASCKVPKVVTPRDDGGVLRANTGEEATYVGRAVERVCASGWPSARLCGVQPRCGDAFCTSGETRTSCAVDCACMGDDCATPRNKTAASPGVAVPPAAKSKSSDSCTALPIGASGQRGSFAVVMLGLCGALWKRRRRTPR